MKAAGALACRENYATRCGGYSVGDQKEEGLPFWQPFGSMANQGVWSFFDTKVVSGY
jgi:hypothetical protein